MELAEKQAKKILEDHGIKVPDRTGEAFVVKAQVNVTDRKAKGGVKFADNREEAERLSREMKSKEIEGREVEEVLIEEEVDVEEEYYVSFYWDTEDMRPAVLFSEEGGSGIENRETRKLDPSTRPDGFEEELWNQIQKLYQVFLEEDMKMLEVNPLAFTGEKYVAVDALAELDDQASFRHEREFEGIEKDLKTERERKAEKIDEDDHRGIAGRYKDMDGDIGMLMAGGGASLTNTDAMIEAGGEPANYMEYGGNPPTEKVYRISKIVMSNDIRGLWHVGGTANNTDIYRTMKGFVEALKEEDPDYPIVVRRDGPNADEAFQLLKETRKELGLQMKLFRNDKPMTETAEVLMEMIE